MPDPRSHQKGDSSTAESGKRGGKRECAGPAFRGVLLGQPKGIDGEVGTAQSQKKETNEKPWKRDRSKIENFAECERDEYHHQSKENRQRAASSQPFGKPRHRQATENRSERDQHDSPGGELGSLRTAASTSFGDRCDRSRNIHGSSPQAADRSQHEQGVHNRATPQSGREQNHKRTPNRPRTHNLFFLGPGGRLRNSMPDPSQQVVPAVRQR